MVCYHGHTQDLTYVDPILAELSGSGHYPGENMPPLYISRTIILRAMKLGIYDILRWQQNDNFVLISHVICCLATKLGIVVRERSFPAENSHILSKMSNFYNKNHVILCF